ncbi:PilT/PilU family type 4a pilus ATPase [Timonella sp. A28]|uniref:type IV pilus twitching motility protein PilT n=1 Tax=Timonella sp. A28 TaxID=3442640 RepID=UPI003EC0AA1A
MAEQGQPMSDPVRGFVRGGQQGQPSVRPGAGVSSPGGVSEYGWAQQPYGGGSQPVFGAGGRPAGGEPQFVPQSQRSDGGPVGVPVAPLRQPVVQSAPQVSQPQDGYSSAGVAGQVPVQEEAAPVRRPRGVVTSERASSSRIGMSNTLRVGDLLLDDVLRDVVFFDASDLHVTDRSFPMIRRAGALTPLEGYEVLEGESLKRSLYSILTQKQRETFEENLELDFAYQVPNGSRFRVNIYQQRDSMGAAFRVIPSEIKPLEDLGVPPVVATFSSFPRGLVLVTGPTGSGKSTTLASIIDLANRTRPDHIMTVEDPIEFLHDHKKSVVNQREVGTDTWSFAAALKHVLRQDPDIILVGEMRDLETISVALTAAETGHLVFATLHTQDAAQTIDRVIDVFPPEQQEQIRVQLAAAIQGVVCQTLCKRANGPGRVVATEVMVATPGIRNLIREGKTHQIYSAMQAGKNHGMHTMDQHLADLVTTGAISYETGVDKCHHVEDFNRLAGRGGGSGFKAEAVHGGY